MQISQQSNFKDLTEWLDSSLKDVNSIIPQTNPLPNISSKGIYFWFMHPKGYRPLSKYVAINQIQPTYSKEINGDVFDLVYLGTTGTGKKGNSNLTIRLKWHINQEHKESIICRKESALSTLRTGLGALLSEDLILPNTEKTINDFMRLFMKVYWVEYPDNKQLIDNDEEILIKKIKPLLNIKNNPNALQSADINPTRIYKHRRNEIEISTKTRLGLSDNKQIKKIVETKMKRINEHCFELDGDQYYLSYPQTNLSKAVLTKNGVNQKVRTVLKDLISREYILIDIYNSKGNEENTNTLAKKALEYFTKNTPENGLISDFTPKNEKIVEGKKYNTANDEFSEQKLELSKNYKVVMICAGSKVPNSELIFNGQSINFKAQSNRANNEFLPDDRINLDLNYTWRDFVLANQNDIPYMAYELYTPNEYQLLNQIFGNRFFILSAGWGLISADFKLPKYDITFSSAAKVDISRKRTFNQPQYNDLNHLENINDNEDIIYIGGKDYLDMFYVLTQNLPNRKIIYWKSKDIPMPRVNLEQFIFRYYTTNRRTTWYYEVAKEIANGIIP